MTVLTSEARTEAQKNRVPPQIRQIISNCCFGVRQINRYTDEHVKRGVSFECQSGNFGSMMRKIRANFSCVRLGTVRSIGDGLYVQVRFR